MFVIYEPLDYDSVHTRMKLKNLLVDAFKIEGIKKGFNLNWLSSFGNQRINYKTNLTNLFRNIKNFPPYLNDVIVRRCQLDGPHGNRTGKCDIVKYNPINDEDEEHNFSNEKDEPFFRNLTETSSHLNKM